MGGLPVFLDKLSMASAIRWNSARVSVTDTTQGLHVILTSNHALLNNIVERYCGRASKSDILHTNAFAVRTRAVVVSATRDQHEPSNTAALANS